MAFKKEVPIWYKYFQNSKILTKEQETYDTIPYNSGPINENRYNSGWIIVSTFHGEYKTKVKRNNSVLNKCDLK